MYPTKKEVTVFSGVFTSGAAGAVKAYLASDEVRRLLGESTSMRISVQTSSRTANCQLVFKLYDTAGPQRPTGLGPGYAATFTSSAITTDFPLPVQVNGPYSSNVDLVLEVSASSGAAVEIFQGTITITLFFT